MTGTLEAKLKTEMKRLIESRGGFWSIVPGGAYGKPGDPDIIACYRGRYIGIEAKNPNGNGRQSDIQKHRQSEIERAGGIYILSSSLVPLIAVLDGLDKEVS